MEEKNASKEGDWDAGRVFQVLGRIGYAPVSAILDIVDNSVSAGATNVAISVNQEPSKEEEAERIFDALEPWILECYQ